MSNKLLLLHVNRLHADVSNLDITLIMLLNVDVNSHVVKSHQCINIADINFIKNLNHIFPLEKIGNVH